MKVPQLKEFALKALAGLLAFFKQIPLLVKTNLLGWKRICLAVLAFTIRTLSSIQITQFAFLAALLLTGLFSVLPWIEYDLNLLGQESVSTGSHLKPLFLLPALAGLILILTSLPRRLTIFYAICAAAGAAYAIGFFAPRPIHVLMLRREDYHFTIWIYPYGAFLAAATAVASRGMVSSLFPFKVWFEKLRMVPPPLFPAVSAGVEPEKSSRSGGKRFARKKTK